jgi:hypothetical protein
MSLSTVATHIARAESVVRTTGTGILVPPSQARAAVASGTSKFLGLIEASPFSWPGKPFISRDRACWVDRQEWGLNYVVRPISSLHDLLST